MNKEEIVALLVRIDERNESLEKAIQESNEQRRCYTNTEKIRSIERIVWTALCASFAAAVKAFWPVGGS